MIEESGANILERRIIRNKVNEAKETGVYGLKGVHLANGGIILLVDGIRNVRFARRVFIHERQHGLTTFGQKRKLAGILGRDSMLEMLYHSGHANDYYKGLNNNRIASEIISRAMELAYDSANDDILREKLADYFGVDNEEFFNFIKSINDEQKMIEVYLEQEGTSICVELPQEVLDKMAQMREQEPEKWEEKEIELMMAAEDSLKG